MNPAAAPTTKTPCIQTRRRFFSAKARLIKTAAGVKSAAVKARALGAAIDGNLREASGTSGTSGTTSGTPSGTTSGTLGATPGTDTHFMPFTLLLVRAFVCAGRRLFKLESALRLRLKAVTWALCHWRHLYVFVSCLNSAIVLRAYLDSACGIR